MLRLSIHAGLLKERCPQNQIAALDIAYQKRAALADYLVSLQLSGRGELEPAIVSNYPRWSGSVWDLVARAITAVLYRSDVAPPVPRVDKRCAYATKMCAVVQRVTTSDAGAEIARVELLQPGRVRGEYHAVFSEDIIHDVFDNDDVIGCGHQLVAGTAWLFAVPEMNQELDRAERKSGE